MTHLCVLGYASLDHKYRTAPFRGAGSTTLVEHPLHGPNLHDSNLHGQNLPGPNLHGSNLHGPNADPGAVAYFARAARRHGPDVSVVSWVGADAPGESFCSALSTVGVDVAGISRTGDRSPTSHMFYPPDGEVVTFYDPGQLDTDLGPAQHACLRAADAVVISVGPPRAIRSALDAIDDETPLMWAVKADPDSMPNDVATRLVERARVITFSVTEANFLRQHCGVDPDTFGARNALVVETHGAEGVRYRHGGDTGSAPATRRADVRDQTGAGDTFAGSLMARLTDAAVPGVITSSPTTVKDAIVGAGHDAAEFLIERELGKN